MLETIVTLVLVVILIVALLGLASTALLVAMYGPGAAAGFATGVTAARMGADPFTSIALALVAFIVVTGLVMRLARVAMRGVQRFSGLRWPARQRP